MITRKLLFSHQELSWFVAYRRTPDASQAEEGTAENWRVLEAPIDHFYADPFVLNWKGRDYLFVEDYLYADRRGVLAVTELGENGPEGPMQRILDLPYHLSYPFVFEEDGRLFMIPETLGSGRVELYSAEAPEGPWNLVKYLHTDLRAVDTTLWKQDGLYYFFTNVMEEGGSPNEFCHLYWSESLTGEWQPHPQNPVCCDVRRSRGAGKLFRVGSSLIRPAQDCSVRYGYALELNEVRQLTPETFEERPYLRIPPTWYPGLVGTHTLNANERWEVTDGQVLRPRYSERGESRLGRWQADWQERLGQQLNSDQILRKTWG